jgi:hypothetical protein
MPNEVNLEINQRNLNLLEMAQKQQLVDTIFHCSDEQLVHAHRLILSSSSTYFAELENRKTKISNLHIFIPAFSRRSVELLVRLFYIGTIVVDDELMQEVNELLVFFRVKDM